MADTGTITFGGEDITKRKVSYRAKKGIVRTFQIEKSFHDLSVFDNVMSGVLIDEKIKTNDAKEKTLDILKKFNLHEFKNNRARDLTIQKRKIIEFARIYATNPKLIILDEVMAGLTTKEIDEVISLVLNILEEGKSFIVIEHIMHVVMSLAGRVFVLETGKKIAEGTPEDVCNNPEVIEAYLGKGAKIC